MDGNMVGLGNTEEIFRDTDEYMGYTMIYCTRTIMEHPRAS